MTPGTNDLCVFAVKRGFINGRFDVRNLKYLQSISYQQTRKVTLGSLIAEEPYYGTSATSIERVDESLPKYIRITDFNDFGIEPNHKYVAAESYSDKHLLRVNDILFARTGGTVGKTYYYDGSIGDAVFAGYCIRFRFDDRKVLPKFVYWCTKTSIYENWVKGIQRPSGQPNINKEEYKSYEIVLPDREIQKELVGIMDTASDKYSKKLQQASKLIADDKQKVFNHVGITFSEYVPKIFSYQKLKDIIEYGIFCNPHSAYLNELFEHLRTNKWYAGYLSEYVDVNPRTERSELTDESIVSFVPMPSVNEKTNHAEYETKKYADVKTGFTIFQKSDLLWAKITPCMQNGKSFLASNMPTDIGFGSTEFHVLRRKSDRIYMPYLWVLLTESHVLEAAQGMFGGSAGQQRIPDTFLKKFPMVLPPLDMQECLADAVFDALEKAKQMRMDAEQEWTTAKVQFEKEL